MSLAILNHCAWSEIPNIYCQVLSRLANGIPPIYIISLVNIELVVLSAFMAGFLIKTDLVIFYITGKMVSIDGEKTKPDIEERE